MKRWKNHTGNISRKRPSDTSSEDQDVKRIPVTANPIIVP